MDIRIECYDCSIIGKSVILPVGDYEDHNTKCHMSFLEACKKCPLRFSYPMDLDAHVAHAHEKELCLECHRNNVVHLIDEDDAHLHYLHEHPFHKVKCDWCLNKFTSQTICDNHANVWHCNVKVPQEVDCPVCHRLFSPKDMEKHSDSHHGYDYKCQKCHRVYRSSGELKVHQSACKSKGK